MYESKTSAPKSGNWEKVAPKTYWFEDEDGEIHIHKYEGTVPAKEWELPADAGWCKNVWINRDTQKS